MIMHCDNKHILKKHCKDINKASDCTKEVGGVMEHVRREVKKIKFTATLEYSNNKLNPAKEFYQQPGSVLMKRWDQKSKEKSQALMNQEVQENVDQIGVQLP